MSQSLRLALALLLVACGGTSGGAPTAGTTSGSDAERPDASTERDSGADGNVAPPGDASPPVDAGVPTRVRVMAANTTSGTQQSYELPGIRIFQGLHPDIVLIQEFRYASGPRALVDTAFGTDFAFYVEPRTTGIPNGIVSRYPILDSGVWADASTTDRAFAWAKIDVPGPIDLWAVSVHLLTTSGTARATEAAQIVDYVNSNVPTGDYLVVGGDFNTETTTEPALSNLAAQVVVAPPFPADQNGNTNTSINRNKPHDWLLARAGLDARQTPVAIGGATFAAGLVFDSRVYTPLADVAPVLVDDSDASGMQHMPVVRDFMVGGN